MGVDLHNPLLSKYELCLSFAKRLSLLLLPLKLWQPLACFPSLMLSFGEYDMTEIIYYVIIKIAL